MSCHESQNRKVLKHLRRASLTSWQAIKRYRITRISARIKDLREAGYRIKTEMETGRNGTRYGRYRLAH